jgi:bifunctional DNA-binding transcriptional regulator/antitoxin component of YhaV-PrlF toxin-antitoxin module
MEVRELKLGAGGEVVIPSSVRKALGPIPGDVRVAHVEDGGLVLKGVRRCSSAFNPASRRWCRAV